jgi:hypothetical protein
VPMNPGVRRKQAYRAPLSAHQEENGGPDEDPMLGPSSTHNAGKDFTDAKGRRWVAAERIDRREIHAPELRGHVGLRT